jgi:hypothetical protein
VREVFGFEIFHHGPLSGTKRASDADNDHGEIIKENMEIEMSWKTDF